MSVDEKPREAKDPSLRIVAGDDAIQSVDQDYLGFSEPATQQLYNVSQSSGVCCAIVGSWGTGKSSFMKLMREYIEKKSEWTNASCVWYTAWDTGSVKSLSDAMLYRFYSEFCEKNPEVKELQEEKKRLEETLGIRRGLRRLLRDALKSTSEIEALPLEVQAAAKLGSGLVTPLDTQRAVQKSFEALFEYLEESKKTVFLFIDELDRADGEQIVPLLAELKLYISHPRVAAVLGFDDLYVTQAIRPHLPQNVDAIRYLEKILTIRKFIPTPDPESLSRYAQDVIHALAPDLPRNVEEILQHNVAEFSLGNPRYVKRLIFSVINHFHFSEKSGLENIFSKIVVSMLAEEGLLFKEEVLNPILEAKALQGVQEAYKFSSSRECKTRLDIAKRWIEEHEIDIELCLALREGRFPVVMSYSLDGEEPPPKRGEAQRFDWGSYLKPILEKFFETKREINGDIIFPSTGYHFNPMKSSSIPSSDLFTRVVESLRFPEEMIFPFVSDQANLAVLLLRRQFGEFEKHRFNFFLSDAPFLVQEREFVLWIIDETGSLEGLKGLVGYSSRLSQGLKNKLTVLFTPTDSIEKLMSFLLKH